MGTNNIDFPAGWRPLDLEIFQKLAYLEAKCISLAQQGDNFVGMIKNLKSIIDVQDSQIERLLRDVTRFDESYYKVFPERLSQDVRLNEQLNGLNSKSVPPGAVVKKE